MIIFTRLAVITAMLLSHGTFTFAHTIVTETEVVLHHGETVPRFAMNPDKVAILDGNWSDPAVWGDSVPDCDTVATAANMESGKTEAESHVGHDVQIPEGRQVVYDLKSSTHIGSIEVAGTLSFASDTMLYCDNIQVLPTGRLLMGSADAPIACKVVICDKEINAVSDPTRIGQGVMNLGGEWIIHGKPKTPALKVQSNVVSGMNRLTLESAPVGWEVGDEILLPQSEHYGQDKTVQNGTRYGKPVPATPRWYSGLGELNDWRAAYRVGEVRWDKRIEDRQDETLVVTAIDGRSVEFEPPLSFDHPFGIDADGNIVGRPYLLNLTRSVEFCSENREGTRGHTMATGNAIVDHNWARFSGMGRTRMQWPLVVTYGQDREDAGITDDNPAARYNWHLHHLVGRGPVVDGHVWRAVGLVTDGAPKWANVVHGTSHGLMSDCISGDSFDAAFTLEDGDEIKNTYVNCHAYGLCRRGWWAAGQHNSWIGCVVHGCSTGWWIGNASFPRTMTVHTPEGQVSEWDYPTKSWVEFNGCEMYGGGEFVGVSDRVGDWTDGKKVRPDTERNVMRNVLSWHNQRMIGNYGETSIELDGFTHVATTEPLESRYGASKWGITSNGSSTVETHFRNGRIHNCDLGVRLRSRGDCELNHFENVDFCNKLDVYRMTWTRGGWSGNGIVHRFVDCQLRGETKVLCEALVSNLSNWRAFTPDRMFINGNQVFFDIQRPDWVIPRLDTRDASGNRYDAQGMTVEEAYQAFGVKLLGDIAECGVTPDGYVGCVACPLNNGE